MCSNDTKLAWKMTGLMVIPATLIITGILWATATKFDHTEWKAISTFAGVEGSTAFVACRWVISRQTFRAAVKRSLYHVWELL
jgi:hypothetical protein